MRRLSFLSVCVGIALVPAWFHAIAQAQMRVGPFEITGFYQYIINPSSGQTNPNNAGFGLLRKSGHPDFLLMRQLLDLNIYAKLTEDLSFTFAPRFWHDLTKSADSHFRQYESWPTDFSGRGNMLRGGGKDFKAEVWQAYVDYRKGDLWLRLGKQQIAWGEAIALRILDVVNPLDLSNFFFFDRAFEEFDRIRIPQWFIRGAYTFPNAPVQDLTLELILNPGAYVPTLLPKQGSPYNVVPGILKIREDSQKGEPTVGGRLTGEVGDVQFSINYVTKPNDDGVGIFKGLEFVPFFRVLLENKHPRIHIIGGSFNYVWESAGAILRGETTVTPNAPFANAADTKVVERPVWKSMISIDRPTYLIPGLDSMTIGLTFFETFTGGRNLHKVRALGQKVDQGVHLFAIFLQQPLFRKRVSLEFLGLFETDDAHWLQPGIHWEIGTNTRLDLFYNEFGGAEKRPGRLGSFFWAEGAFFRFTYGF